MTSRTCSQVYLSSFSAGESSDDEANVTLTSPPPDRNLPKVRRTGNTDDEMSASSCSTDGGALTSLRLAYGAGRHEEDTDAVLSDASSQPDVITHPSMLESWLLTPTPIFDLGEERRSRLPVGPLENELIEHPSMSVYHATYRMPRPSSVGDSSSGESSVEMLSVQKLNFVPSDAHTEALVEESSISAAFAARQAELRSRARPTPSHEVVQRHAELALQRSARAQQAGKKRREQKQLKRSQLQRHNDVSQKLASRPARRNQQQHCSRRSNAVNNRKSQ